MPQEGNSNCPSFTSPAKNFRGFKALASSDYSEETINDNELALRKAEEAASRRYQAAEWLRQMDQGALGTLPKEPSEEDFCLALRNGLVLCNVLNKVNPGAIHKVVESPILDVQSTEGPAHSAIQYFENMRNFLVAVKDMKLLTFEASDLEKGGSSNKVVDCILCLKGYYEWKQAGGIGVWRYGGTVRITSFPKSSSSSLVGSESADESIDESESSQYDQLLDFIHFSNEVSTEESKIANVLTFLFDHFGLGLLQAYLRESDGLDDLPLNAMVIDALLSKVVKDFSGLLVSQGTQLAMFMKKILKGERGMLSKSQFMEAISQYLRQRTSMASSDFSEFCTCGGKREVVRPSLISRCEHADLLHFQSKQLEELRFYYQETKLEVRDIHSNWEEDLRRLNHHVKSLEVASSSYHKVLEENRMLYNQVQDLKGTIRVYCRVRPFLPGQSNRQSVVDYIGETGNIMIVNPFKQGKDARKVFTFNKVFGANATQEQIYVDTQPLVRSILDGYNVCIFAYGQTGSGKTYTMSGPDLTSEDTWGVNYRALRDLFHLSKVRLDVIKYDVAVQMIEIYNEQVRDLLVNIRNSPQLNGLNVPDASLVPVTCTQDVLEWMKIGQSNRAVGATALNERSSRSHSVLTVHVQGKELVSGSILRGCLHLVDLAGSERVDKSEAVGERLKEAQHINRSLSALGDVISALAQKSSHIPYRNSKLTQVLQESLGGQAKTLMFVHINPEVNALGETISTLKFAERVASIELGAARSNKETGEIRELKDEISNLKLALERKEAELEQAKAGTARSAMEQQKARAVSPFRLPKYSSNGSLKPENGQRPIDDAKSSELQVRSCSSGKQRKSRLPAASDKDGAQKPRSPSPPVRRSISTDRGSTINTRVKAETVENPPIARVPFPARVPVSRSVTSTLPSITPAPADNSLSKVHLTPQELPKQDDMFDWFLSLQNSKKIHQEREDEQLRQALNIRQGGIRKSKPESKASINAKHQLPSRTQALDAATKAFSYTDTCGKIDEDHVADFLGRKQQRHFPRSSQNVESREPMLEMEGLLTKKLENKPQNGPIRNAREGATPSMPEFRRSRSTPRGKFPGVS
ncbi:hypothetical protein CDL15_Pgr011444 [Punica granatum]|uniref:Kinesin-like protein KIN-14F n=2 Tax=Punica granatum TaxID=22663 RepID=A0A218WF72_PUNGR|nr:hypothetical protein CDL15_Pgr011444 [Punica granatum]